jgi:uracil-DNA glycosylase
MKIALEESWKKVMMKEFGKPYFKQLVNHIKTEKEQGKEIFPAGSHIFNAFEKTPFAKVKVVILGQDPYHGAGQANGLSFSVAKGIQKPPSLLNILKELQTDLGVPIPESGNLEKWALQGVLLLNASLTVRASEPMSHAKIGWADFTDEIIRKISVLNNHVVFILWGKFAQEKRVLIDPQKHMILRCVHPSPLSVHKGFFGSRPFSQTNEYLMRHGKDPIDWSL